MRAIDLMALVSFLQVSFMWYVSLRFLSKITSGSRTRSLSEINDGTVKKELLNVRLLVNRDVNDITSDFSA